MSNKTLFERIGGKDALDAAVEIFYDKILADKSISHFFKNTDMKAQKAKQKAFLAFAFGGPVQYTGKDMDRAHAKVREQGMTEEHFGAVAGHLVETLKELKVPQELIDEVVTIALSVKDDVLGNNESKNKEDMALGKNLKNSGSQTKSKSDNKDEGTGGMYMKLLEGAADAVVVIDETKTVIFWNATAEKIWGYTAEETIGKNIKHFVPSEHQRDHDEYVNRNLKTGENRIVGMGREVEVERKDGTRTPVMLTMTKVEDGDKTFYMATVKDITEQKKLQEQAKQAAEEIQAQEEELRQNMEELQATQEAIQAEKAAIQSTLDQALNAVITIDKNNNVTYYNPAAENMFGYSRDEVMGQNVKMIVPVEHRAPHDSYVNANRNTGVNKVVGRSRDLEATRKDGSRFWINLSLSKVETENGINYTAFIKDVTAERENLLNMEGIKQTIDQSFAFIEFDKKGNIQNANENFVHALGYSSEKDIVGGHHSMFVESEYKNSNDYKNFWNDLGNGITQSGQFKRITRGGDEIWIQASYTPLKDESGEVYKVIKIATDITEQKKAAQETENAANEVRRVINSLANGDLTQRYEIESTGHLKEMGEGLNGALENLSDVLGSINQIANLVAASSEELLTKADQMQGTTQEVASAIQQMAEGAHQQASQTDEASKLVEEVLRTSNETGAKADQINGAAETGQKSANDGLSTVKKVVENMLEIENSAGVTSKSISILTERSEEIARTLNVITDIAAQTNLLALNAAIEAARAGDAGRGFAVVAEEIRKLAEDSRKSAVDIEKVITEVQKDITQASKAIDTMDVSVKSGNTASREAEVVFQSIEKSTTDTLLLSQEIQRAGSIQKDAINETVKNIEKIVVVSEETAAGTEQIATSSKDLSLGMDEVAATSKELAGIATQLQEGVARFQL